MFHMIVRKFGHYADIVTICLRKHRKADYLFIYYAISPTLVKWFGNTQWFKNMWKPKLDKMVNSLRNKGVEDTPYDDKLW